MCRSSTILQVNSYLKSFLITCKGSCHRLQPSDWLFSFRQISHLHITVSPFYELPKMHVSGYNVPGIIRLQSRGLESLTAGLQSLRLASRIKPWLRSIDGLGWLMAASHGLRVQTRQEAQLLLGDRATRKHAKDCRNGRGNDNLG